MGRITNIAAYQFAPLQELRELRRELLRRCQESGLKGTILLSPEGVNLFVAGAKEAVEELLRFLRAIPGLEGLQAKVSESEQQPFNRMLVRLKKEIIAFGVEGIDPARRPSPKISARQLRDWIEEGKPVTLLDTRNDYEVKLGTFRNAVALGIDHFREFPGAVREKLAPELKEQPIVMFCTGGIRCEKAGPFMEREGFKNIFQLEGGILKYFEECGGAHYEGECFVFDQRVGLDPTLQETESDQCFVCLSPLTKEEQADARYEAGKSCPYCFKTPEQEMGARVSTRNEQIRELVDPLPGSVAYDNYRPMTVPADCEGGTVAEFLGRLLPHVAREEWVRLEEAGLLVDRERMAVRLEQRVRAGERYYQKYPGLVEPAVNGAITILHEDEALVVLDKPAPLPMHAGGRFNRNTLQYILNLAYHPQKPRPAHRLDANTTGLVLLTRTRHFAGRLQPQFARGEVKKRYLARVKGEPRENEFRCEAAISAEPGELGARKTDEAGLVAVTEFSVVRRLGDGTTLVEARPLTGRTNQIRLHLASLGLPILGDRAYLAGGELGDTQTGEVRGEPLCLHAWRLEFAHPLDGRRMEFESAAPGWVIAGQGITS